MENVGLDLHKRKSQLASKAATVRPPTVAP